LQKAKRLLLLSGTPALARPVELWTQVYALAPDLFGSYQQYTKQFCSAHRGRFGWDVSGLSNPQELHSKLRQVMVRRLKQSVLHELPPKQRSMIPITVTDKKLEKESRELMDDLKATRTSVADLVGNDAQSAHFEARRLLMMAYQQSGIAKATAVANYLVDWLDGSGKQKILVFCHHQQVMQVLEDAVAKKYKGAGHIRIDGSVDSKERALRVKKFQTHAKTRVALLSMTAAGVGLTMTAASSVLFAELHWTPGVLAQAEDRCHRIGQRNAVNVMYCVCMDHDISVDMSLWNMLGRKVGTLGKVIDGCQNASLQADHGAPNAPVGESVEEGLTRFFAENAFADKRNEPPVKGSITSYFQPAKEAEKTGGAKPPVACSKQTAALGAVDLRMPSEVEWQCEACTFINKQAPPRNGLLSCELCATPFVDMSKQEAVAATSTRKELIVLDDTKPSPFARNMPEIVTINDEDDDEVDENSSPRSARILEVATVDDGDGVEACLSVVTPAKKEDQPLLRFSVSKNSGRITLCDGSTGGRLNCNFDIHEVITEETTDRLLEVQVARWTSNAVSSVEITFDDVSIKEILQPMFERLADPDRCLEEIKEFVNNYLQLREVEKKVVRDSGKSFAPFDLKQKVARLLASTVTQSKERYSGGAKERARENLQKGVATEHDKAILHGKACAWCGGNLSYVTSREGVESTYCSNSCAEQGRLMRGGMCSSTQIRAHVFGLEGGVCQLCCIDAHALYTRLCALRPAERLNALINAKWALPKSGPALERLLQNPREGDFWQADHIIAVSEGGGGCGLDNLRTLCTPCHQNQTNRLRARLRLGSSDDGKRKQMDIRSAFFFGVNKRTKK
jgi:hypothetical protein